MKTKILSVLLGLSCLIQPLFAQDAATDAAPVIPEAAREHFVMGNTLYSNATSVAGFNLAAKEFQQAADLAPQWSKPRYNLALTEEAAEDYAGAITDLKRYQSFNLAEAEARAVQDKIYTLKAKQKLKETEGAENKTEGVTAAAKRIDAELAAIIAQQDALDVFVGKWQRQPDANEYLDIRRQVESETLHIFYRNRDCTEVKLEGKKLKFALELPNLLRQKITITPDGQGKLEVEVSTVWCVDSGQVGTDKRTFIRR